jgi:hypothetical protein
MKPATIVFAAALIPALSAPLEAETLTLACKLRKFTETSELLSPEMKEAFNRVDQIFIDLESPTLELRVANTIGTSHEEVYSFHDLGAESCGKLQIQKLSNGEISGSQQCGAPVGFFYSPGLHQFLMSQLFLGGGVISEWECR